MKKLIKNIIKEEIKKEEINSIGDMIENIYPNDRLIFSKEKIINFKNVTEQQIDYKPKGLWYGFGNSWFNFLKWDAPKWFKNYNHIHILKPNQNNILSISSIEELSNFTNNYKIKNEFDWNLIDWKKVSQYYSGIEINPYIYKARLDKNFGWYYGWDIASGCIWNNNAIKSIELIY